MEALRDPIIAQIANNLRRTTNNDPRIDDAETLANLLVESPDVVTSQSIEALRTGRGLTEMGTAKMILDLRKAMKSTLPN